MFVERFLHESAEAVVVLEVFDERKLANAVVIRQRESESGGQRVAEGVDAPIKRFEVELHHMFDSRVRSDAKG